VLIHRSALEGAGIATLDAREPVECDVVPKLRGLQASRLASPRADGLRAPFPPLPPPNPRQRRRPDPVEKPEAPWVDAECKWFSRPKGYGFIVVTPCAGTTQRARTHRRTARERPHQPHRRGPDRNGARRPAAANAAPRHTRAGLSATEPLASHNIGLIGEPLSIDE
jgi:cold shock CspA family protein